jgi:hypothetical protein
MRARIRLRHNLLEKAEVPLSEVHILNNFDSHLGSTGKGELPICEVIPAQLDSKPASTKINIKFFTNLIVNSFAVSFN